MVRIIIGKVIALEGKSDYYFVIINRRAAITAHKYYAKCLTSGDLNCNFNIMFNGYSNH